ncbi:hypothetical protein QR680_006372 [Steinernema hermaphroditum]|uniref:U4/U6.U5 tri-snRNP-associated protein 1 n=1 Tax=Steinernema hermaphroditum TaxID=289476 RepID=A0AA39LX13_9BILA|nr:hypothetical protein QR680_006372 [Steinernema hermaphroditum]
MGGRDYRKKRKAGVDEDTSEEGVARRQARERRQREREERGSSRSSRSRSGSPTEKKSKRTRERSPAESGGGGGGGEESLSIEETNKLRAQLGLAPLEVDDGPKIRESESGDPNEKVVVEDGFEFVHKPADSWTAANKETKVKERLEAAKASRKIKNKVLTQQKGLADSESDDESAASWVAKSRQLEEERKRAAEKAKELDALDEENEEASRIEEEKRKAARAKARAAAKERAAKAGDPSLGGLIVGHSKEAFLDGRDTILVLQDKSVLDDDGEEVLVNPNLVENEMHKKNVELRKRKEVYRPYEQAMDEFGESTGQVLAKYDEELEGMKRETFRLDAKGELDVEQEAEEDRIKRELEKATRNLQTLDQEKFKVASEFYTEEEMISFRKPKKKKDGKKLRKKGKVLKADDLMPEAADDDDRGSRESRQKRLAARRHQQDEEDVKMETEAPVKEEDETEEGELPEEAPSSKLQNFAKSLKDDVDEEEDESEDDTFGGVDIAGVFVDDDAEDELSSALEKTRRLRQQEVKQELKEEPSDDEEDMETDQNKRGMVIDSTSEYCRNLGEIPTYGLAGNRDDVDEIDFEDFRKEIKQETPEEEEVEDEDNGFGRRRRSSSPSEDEDEQRPSDKRGEWVEATATSHVARKEDLERRYRDDRKVKKEESSDDEDYESALGQETDASKGVGAMLKLAQQKGYLEAGKKRSGTMSLKHLESRNYSKVETSRYDIEEKYTKKLERMGTTGSGPVRSFAEKKGYNPEVKISYTDSQGREMDAKQAFRELSWKFHGKRPGLKQQEKRMAQSQKKELMKKMNSSDTPLGTLSKQLKKQEQEQSPFIFISGGTQLKKD